MATQIEPDVVDADGFRVHVLLVAQAVKKGRHEGRPVRSTTTVTARYRDAVLPPPRARSSPPAASELPDSAVNPGWMFLLDEREEALGGRWRTDRRTTKALAEDPVQA